MTEASGPVLITGFGPFPGVPINPSADAAVAVAKRLGDRFLVRVVALTLPTEWTEAPLRLREAIDHHRVSGVVMCGVSHRARSVVIETVARNLMTAVDAAGRLPDREIIDSGAPAFLRSRWPARRIVGALRAAGVPAVRSLNAGSYLCNRVLFEALALSQTRPRLKHCGFVHLPQALAASPDARFRACSPSRLSSSDAETALEIILSELIQDVALRSSEKWR